jgi:hypothetical protein
VTRYLDSALASRACSLRASVAAAPRVRTGAPSLRVSGYPSVSAKAFGTGVTLGYGTHDRFAMADINAKVWPLSPKDWSSG